MRRNSTRIMNFLGRLNEIVSLMAQGLSELNESKLDMCRERNEWLPSERKMGRGVIYGIKNNERRLPNG
jgi:hypothetical protein